MKTWMRLALVLVIVVSFTVMARAQEAAPGCAQDEVVLDLSTETGSEAAIEPAVDFSALSPLPEETLQPAAICRLIPQCDANVDCDAGCGGAGLGKCVHSKCPVRVCRCR